MWANRWDNDKGSREGQRKVLSSGSLVSRSLGAIMRFGCGEAVQSPWMLTNSSGHSRQATGRRLDAVGGRVDAMVGESGHHSQTSGVGGLEEGSRGLGRAREGAM